MLYKLSHSVSANTTAKDPDWQKLQVMQGRIKQWVMFPNPEAADQLHIRIVYHGYNIFPWGGDSWFTLAYHHPRIEENINLDIPPYELDVYAYNEDDKYPHEYYIHPIIICETPSSIPKISASNIEKIKMMQPEAV